MRKFKNTSRLYKRAKKREFREALSALNRLDHASYLLPEDVCLKIWQAVKEVESAQELWLSKHEAFVVEADS